LANFQLNFQNVAKLTTHPYVEKQKNCDAVLNQPCNNLMCINPTGRTKEPSKTKVTYFQYTFAVDQQIIRLQILQQYATAYIKQIKV